MALPFVVAHCCADRIMCLILSRRLDGCSRTGQRVLAEGQQLISQELQGGNTYDDGKLSKRELPNNELRNYRSPNMHFLLHFKHLWPHCQSVTLPLLWPSMHSFQACACEAHFAQRSILTKFQPVKVNVRYLFVLYAANLDCFIQFECLFYSYFFSCYFFIPKN